MSFLVNILSVLIVIALGICGLIVSIAWCYMSIQCTRDEKMKSQSNKNKLPK